MKTTPNFGLKKPDPEDFYNIEDFNENADVIDAALTPSADPTQIPTGNGPGKLSQWIGWLTNRIQAITGKANWWESPTKSIEQLNNDVIAHLNESAQNEAHPGLAEMWNARIVEMGENANGIYVRWENGLQACFGRVTAASAVTSGEYTRTVVILPATFRDDGYKVIVSTVWDKIPVNAWIKFNTEYYNVQQFDIVQTASENGTGPQEFDWLAIGRWK